MSPTLPASARLAWWGTAWLRGHVVTDLLIDAVIADDATHAVSGLDPAGGTDTFVVALGRLRALGATAFGAAIPVEGDPVGLGGPRDFNTAALDVGEAVVVSGAGVGLVPERVGAAITWTAMPAERRQLPDVGEADRTLRAALLESAGALARLDVARWRPEVADELMNLRHRPHLDSPAGVPPRCVDLASRGVQALGIVDLALEDDGGAVSAHEIEARRASLVPLARAGRRALVAACSPEVWPPS
ncbi:hypothetical protein [Nocardioides sp. LS1]|uniref:hypothetical protein n=1 Tax=Nocardioides sp. LS1 TaxID=1027620 RepID=UPI000F61FCC0|nr:hypothetical protein [Nocardioides sp. LS1]GCD89142.1 hypothetical protein NLS1_11480 [Nocardioides sp. LS1]